MSYQKFDIYKFGAALLLTKDIDPVYVALENSGWDKVTKARWCLAYWCLYNAGVASYIAEDPAEFWPRLRQAALNEFPAPTGERWPRGKERRHWRGKQALASLADLHKRYAREPELFVAALGQPKTFICIGTLGAFNPDPLPFKTVSDAVQEHVGFGPWMAFKIADMLEQVFHVPVNFDNAAVFMFKDPYEAALRLWRRLGGFTEKAVPRDKDDAVNRVVAHLGSYFKEYDAPTGKRKVGLQEIETILCKWKSHENGHYPLANDLHEFSEGLKPWVKHSRLAADLALMKGLGGVL